MRILRFAAVAATMILVTAGSATAHPLITFATFQSTGDAPTIQWDQDPGQPSGGFVSTGATTANATIHFLDVPLQYADYPYGEHLAAMSVLGDIPAIMSISGYGSYISDPGDFRILTTISFLYAGVDPLVVNGVTYNTGANLLSATTSLSPRTGNFWAWHYTSDFENFNYQPSGFQGGDMTFADEPVFHDVRYWPTTDDYSTQVSGYFTSGVPEPASWAMMILGFGMIGALTRGRRRLAA